MKKFLVLVLVAVAVGVMVLIYTGKSISDVIPLQALKDLLPSRGRHEPLKPGGPSVQKFVLQDNSEVPTASTDEGGDASGDTRDVSSYNGLENTQVAMVDPADTTPGVPSDPNAQAGQLLEDAKKLMKEGKIGEAKLKIERVAGLRCKDEFKQEAAVLSRDGVPLFEKVYSKGAAPLDDIKTFKMDGGRDIVGWIVREDARSVSVKMEDGVEITLQKENISKTISMTAAERRASVMNEYYALKEKSEKNNALAEYDLAVFCRQKGLEKETGRHLEEALNIDTSVYKAVRDREAKNLYMLAVYFGSLGQGGKEKEYEGRLKRDYPDSKYLALLGEEAEIPAPAEAIPPLADNTTSSRSSSTDVLVTSGEPPKPKTSDTARARTATTPRVSQPAGSSSSMSASSGQYEADGNRYYQKGLELYRQSLPLLKSGSRSFDSVNKQALNAFQNAVDSYQKAKSAGKASSNIDSKIAQANSLKYGCYKMSRVR